MILILDNIRSAHNVGSIFRTADGFGVEEIICVGITPYPKLVNDKRLPHIAFRATNQIAKTALGAEKTVKYCWVENIAEVKDSVGNRQIVGLEQTKTSILLNEYKKDHIIALIVGNEPNGLSPEALKLCSVYLEIPMLGHKESFNVAVATGIALYALTFPQA